MIEKPAAFNEALEKIMQEIKDENDIPKGIVKWYVDVYDNTGESVAIATILTMVRLRDLVPVKE